MDKSVTLEVTLPDQGLNLLAFLRKHCGKERSVKSLKRLVDGKSCLVNGRVEWFSTHPLKQGDRVSLSLPKTEVKTLTPSVLFEDEYLMVINKDPYTVSHPDEFKGLYLVHRLDKETSGVLILAKTIAVQSGLDIAFKERKVTKKYLAIVEKGFPDEPVSKKGFLTKVHYYQGMSLYGSDKEKGKFALTHFKLVAKNKNGSLVECHPVTGRTHQIRVHLKELKHPIIGDHLYNQITGGPHVKRQMLHSYETQFEHPITKEIIQVKAPLPADFLKTLNDLALPYGKAGVGRLPLETNNVVSQK